MTQDDGASYEYPSEAFHAGGWEPPPRRDRRRYRVVGIVVVLALILLGGGTAWVGLFASSGLPAPLPPEVSKARNAAATQLVTGHCLAALPADGNVATVRLVPCGEEHAAEIWSQYAFDEDAVWPGQEAAHSRVARSCQLPGDLVEIGVTLVTWAPSPASWQRGDRTGLCVAVLPAPSSAPLA